LPTQIEAQVWIYAARIAIPVDASVVSNALRYRRKMLETRGNLVFFGEDPPKEAESKLVRSSWYVMFDFGPVDAIAITL
jgi:hypothetical protein